MEQQSHYQEELYSVLQQVTAWIVTLQAELELHQREQLLVLTGVSAALLVCVLITLRRLRTHRALISRQQGEISRLGEMLRLREVAPPEKGVEDISKPSPEVVCETIEETRTGELGVPKSQALQESAVRSGLQKSRNSLLTKLSSFFSGRSRVAASDLESLEEVLIVSDVGARCASSLVSQVKDVAEKQGSLAPAELMALLQEGVVSTLIPTQPEHRIYKPDLSPLIVLVVGVNGVGKTTTVAKLATRYMAQGKKVLAVAADTFRAAAVEQLAEWSSRVGFSLVRGAEGAKPSAVVFDGMAAAIEGNYDVVLIDTAGRLHTKSNLMQELEGVRNVIRKHVLEGPHETVLVVDGVSGQNALSQAREFNSAVPLTGIVITKLDGTPKGGIVVAISQELKLPVFFIGVGERVEDLIAFDRGAFVNALFSTSERGYQELTSIDSKSVGNT